MAWIIDKIIMVVTVAAIIFMALTDFDPILGTLILIAILTIIIMIIPSGKNAANEYVKSSSCSKDLDIKDMYKAIKDMDFGDYGSPRLDSMTLVSGVVIILENPLLSDYFYIYKNRASNELLVGTSKMKSYIVSHGADIEEDLDEMDNSLGKESTSEMLFKLHCMCRNYAESGIVSFEVPESIRRENSKEAPWKKSKKK